MSAWIGRVWRKTALLLVLLVYTPAFALALRIAGPVIEHLSPDADLFWAALYTVFAYAVAMTFFGWVLVERLLHLEPRWRVRNWLAGVALVNALPLALVLCVWCFFAVGTGVDWIS